MMYEGKEINTRILELETRLREQGAMVEQVLDTLEPRKRKTIEDYLHTLSEFCTEYALLVLSAKE